MRTAILIWLLMTANLSAAYAGSSLKEIRSEFDRVTGEITPRSNGPIQDMESSAYSDLIRSLWSIVADWCVTYLNSHPMTSAGQLVKHLKRLNVDSSVVQLTGGDNAAYVIAPSWGWGGTFFIIAKEGSLYGVVWKITDVSDKHFHLRDDLGQWSYYVPGFHDGPLSGVVFALPPSAIGHPRFYVDGITLPSVGLEKPGQISVWEWDGTQATCLFVKNYPTHGLSHSVIFKRNSLLIHVNEEFRTFFNCGSCDPGPYAIWKLQVDPDGIREVETKPVHPEIRTVDELLERILHHEDATELASPEVIQKLNSHFFQPGEIGDIDSLGMGTPTVSHRGKMSIVHLSSDNLHAFFHMHRRNESFFVAEVKVLDD